MMNCPNCGNPVQGNYCPICNIQFQQGQQPYYPPQPPAREGMSIGVIIAIVVIAIVVITIIVAAVLYVMVIGVSVNGGTTPAGSWNNAEATSDTSGKLTFGRFTADVAPLDLKIFVYEDGNQTTTLSWYSNTGYVPSTMDENPNVQLRAEYTDYNAAGGLINSGDYIELTNLQPGTTYRFEVFHIPTDSMVQMTGLSGTFTTPYY